MTQWEQPQQPETNLGPYNIFFPGYDGAPYRGKALPNIKSTDAPPEEVLDGKIRVFDLSIDADKAEYNRIIDCVAKGLYILCVEDRHWAKDDRLLVYARWCERFTEHPNAKFERVSVNESGQINFRSR